MGFKTKNKNNCLKLMESRYLFLTVSVRTSNLTSRITWSTGNRYTIYEMLLDLLWNNCVGLNIFFASPSQGWGVGKIDFTFPTERDTISVV